jgi:ATP-dependent DNA ligase
MEALVFASVLPLARVVGDAHTGCILLTTPSVTADPRSWLPEPVAPMVCEVTAEIVLEIAFDSVRRSTRHKSGLAMRFPRLQRVRRDKPSARPKPSRRLA